MSGSIPDEMGALTELTTLMLGSNKIFGSIPNALSALTKLTLLQIGSGNKLTGSIPEGFANLTQLTTLRLDNNKLSGLLPALPFKQMNTSTSFCCLDGNLPGFTCPLPAVRGVL
jgi:LRR receptor-like serine/threonine-protein kinase FLS2